MRVWLVDDRRGDPGSLEALLSQIANRPDGGFRFVGTRPFGPDFAVELRAQQPDILVVNEPAWPEDSGPLATLGWEPSILVATSVEKALRFQGLAERHALGFIPSTPSLDCLRLGLLGAAAALQRQAQWKMQMDRLQHRLNDRIVIERAKGIMVQMLGITEEEAYKRLRLHSRRERRQIKDIAQAILDSSHCLFPPPSSDLLESANGESRRAPPNETTPQP